VQSERQFLFDQVGKSFSLEHTGAGRGYQSHDQVNSQSLIKRFNRECNIFHHNKAKQRET